MYAGNKYGSKCLSVCKKKQKETGIWNNNKLENELAGVFFKRFLLQIVLKKFIGNGKKNEQCMFKNH